MNYIKQYNLLIEKYGTWEKPKDIYTERHRKLPGCMGGKYVKGNAFYLPARAHFIAHWLLAKIHYDNPKVAHALFRMSNQRKYGSKIYSWAKKHWADLIRGENNPAKRVEVRKKISENNPMNNPDLVEKAARWSRSEEGRKFTSKQFSGDKNPSCRPEVKVKRAEHLRIRHANGDSSVDFSEDKSPLRNPEIKAKVLQTRAINRSLAEKEGKPYGVIPIDKHPMKKPENQKAASENAKRQWADPEMRAKMSAAIKAALARKKFITGK